MAKIKCCYLACKYNSAVLTRGQRGFDSDVEMGECKFDGEIELVDYECGECGNDNEGMTCNQFVFKPEVNNHNQQCE